YIPFDATLHPSTGLTYTWTIPTPCSGTPTVSNITGNSSLCGTSFSIYNQSAGNYSYGMTYTWEVSTNGSSFSPVSSGTVGKGRYSLTNASLPLYYRVKAVCANSSDSGYSAVFNLSGPDTTVRKW